MLLWQVKANALRLMFADSDMNFDQHDFEEGIVYENSNTREKLVLMEDSIRRAIDLYYQYHGTKVSVGRFRHDGNEIGLLEQEWVGFPTKVDAEIYQTNEDERRLVRVIENIPFFWDEFNREIILEKNIIGDVTYRVWYKTAKKNLPYDVSEMEYDLNELRIDEEVQRMIPYFIKGELYEEDEPNVAMAAKNEYIYFVRGLRKAQAKVQTKVKSAPVFRR